MNDCTHFLLPRKFTQPDKILKGLVEHDLHMQPNRNLRDNPRSRTVEAGPAEEDVL